MDLLLLFLSLSAAMFGIGLYGLISKRNMLRMLLAAEVNFNAAMLALLTFAATSPEGAATGGIIALLAIGMAAADVGIMVSIAILMFHLKHKLDVYELEEFKG
jgi:NADH-quinone oxidoreductase subunit K